MPIHNKIRRLFGLRKANQIHPEAVSRETDIQKSIRAGQVLRTEEREERIFQRRQSREEGKKSRENIVEGMEESPPLISPRIEGEDVIGFVSPEIRALARMTAKRKRRKKLISS